MGPLSSEIVDIIYQLLPGFLVAWLIYGLTAYLKPSPFERVVQALIFTVIVRVLTITTKHVVLLIGESFSVGNWTEDLELTSSVLIAISLGVFLAWSVNNDFPLFLLRRDGEDRCWKWLRRIHKRLTKFGITEKTLYPSEWYTAFSTNDRYVVLYLKGGRRLFGWPKQYPDDPNKGHFIITQPEWLLDDGTAAPLHTVEEVLVSTSEVERVDFLKMPDELLASEEEIGEISRKLVKLQTEEKKNDN